MRVLKSMMIFIWVTATLGSELPAGFSINLYYGQNQYLRMTSLKSMENSMLEAYQKLDIPAKIVQSFPASVTRNFQFMKHLPKYSIGIYFTQNASGGRIHYADYSGSLKADYTLSNIRFGALFRSPNLGGSRLKVYQSTQLGMMSTKFRVNEELKIWESTNTDHLTVETLAYCIEPGLDAEIMMFGGISMGVYTGANLIIYSPAYHLANNKDATLVLENNKAVKPDWVDFQIALKVGFAFGSLAPQPEP